jgi:hypothetical protein
VLCNGLARYDDAFAAAEDACEDPHELWFSNFALVELIEAADRSGRDDRAAEALEILSTSTSASGTPWALGVEARSRAVVADGHAAELLYREAIERLEPTRLRVDLVRARLLYGELLRRERRRVDAREQLRIAHDFFSDAGMEAFAERARIELRATGEQAARERTLGAILGRHSHRSADSGRGGRQDDRHDTEVQGIPADREADSLCRRDAQAPGVTD